MDILYYLSPNMEIENLTAINELIVGQLQKLIDQEKILNMFPFQGLINKYQKEKMNMYMNEEEEIEDNIKEIILEDKSYLMDYIKKLFDKKIEQNDKFFPIDNPNFVRKDYEIIEYKEKDIYDNKLSEENKNLDFSIDDNILNNNDNNPIFNLVKKIDAKDEEIKRMESINPNDFKKIMRPDIRLEINQTFKQLGFAFITLDMQGYRSGSMDEGIM